MGQMDGKVAIVTGSGRGIGKEIALRLVRDGAKVVINDIDEAPAKETIAEIEKMGGKAVACNGDVAKPDFGDRIVKTAVDAFGGCHVVVNNAGYTWDSVIQKMSDEQWYAILDVHLTAPRRGVCEPVPDDRLRFATGVARRPVRVRVGGVDRVEAVIDEGIEDGEGGRLIDRPAEDVGAEHERGDVEAGGAEGATLGHCAQL